jgi:chaperonin GroEL
MAAKLATVEERISAVRDSSAIGDESIIPRSVSGNPQVDGIQFDCGYLSPYFVTDPERMEVVFENVYILIHETKIRAKEDLLPLLAQITKSGSPLLIIAEDLGSGALSTLVVNKLRGPLRVAAVRAPSGDQRHSMLQDIAFLTGGKAMTDSRDIPLRDIKLSDLGQAGKITVDKNRTVIEGRAKYGQFSFEPGTSAHSNAHTSPARSSFSL